MEMEQPGPVQKSEAVSNVKKNLLDCGAGQFDDLRASAFFFCCTADFGKFWRVFVRFGVFSWEGLFWRVLARFGVFSWEGLFWRVLARFGVFS
jgi:hypothetical protein